MKKKIWLILSLCLVVVVLGMNVGVAFADGGATKPANNAAVKAFKVKLQFMKRVIAIKDETKVDAFLAKLVTDGKLTTEQAAKAKELWQNARQKIQVRQAVHRILAIKDEAKLDTILAKLTETGKITTEQATKLKAVWMALQ